MIGNTLLTLVWVQQAKICRLFAQDYGHRRAGVPDCVLWRPVGRTFIAPPEEVIADAVVANTDTAVSEAGDTVESDDANAGETGTDELHSEKVGEGAVLASDSGAPASPAAATANSNGDNDAQANSTPVGGRDDTGVDQKEVAAAKPRVQMECMFVEVKSPNDRSVEINLLVFHRESAREHMMGYSDPPREGGREGDRSTHQCSLGGGSLLPSRYADVRSPDDVIAIPGYLRSSSYGCTRCKRLAFLHRCATWCTVVAMKTSPISRRICYCAFPFCCVFPS